MFRVLAPPLAVLLALGAGCVVRPPPERLVTDDDDASSAVTVQVLSHNFNNVEVLLFAGARRLRLGMAGGHRMSVFRIPWRWVAGATRVRLIADPIAVPGVVSSGYLPLAPGSLVIWTVEADLSASTAIVY